MSQENQNKMQKLQNAQNSMKERSYEGRFSTDSLIEETEAWNKEESSSDDTDHLETLKEDYPGLSKKNNFKV